MNAHQPAFGKTQSTRSPEPGGRRMPSGFWHRPDWMNLVADILILLASVMIGVALVKLAVRMPMFSLREVVIVSPLSHVTGAQLEYVAQSALGGNFFTVNLEKGRKAFENLPWVRSAQLRRSWPGAIEVSLEEHVAVAYWRSTDSGDTRLVNGFGELFDAAANASMPVFSGPNEASNQILQQMRRFNEMLQPVNLKVVAVSLSGRQAWQIKLDNGMVVEVGKDQAKAPLEERFKRFVDMIPQLREKFPHPVVLADLRYQSGFALRMAGSEQGKGKQ